MALGKTLPGQRSNVALLLTSLWTIVGLFVLIIGHLTMVFYAYGIFTGTDAIAELKAYLPMLEQEHFYIVAGLAILLDIWILVSQKKQREYKIKR